ncbi:ead/Ea22-like family protein [Klebsiella pneumoniae]|uniref:ead/Ea22-like family protein n=1 Tax=Klebsiella pneumoniae TaxID=573 RepID=UPI001E4AB9FE|nr:ead/Ea22-like family protein [Klebsiella pneumoniae]
MTDITKLAQREKFEAWWEREYKHLESSKYTDAVPHIKYGFWMAYQAGGAELVEALEKAQQYAKERDEENQDLMLTIGRFRVEREGLEAIRAAAEKLVRCKGRYHSEQNYRALAALFGVNTPDLPPLEHENVHYADAAEMEIEALRQRIAELEENNAQVIQSRDHYKRMTEEGLKQLAEARTVKLPDLRQIVSGDRYVWSDGVYNYSQDVKVALAAAGIKVEDE